MDLTSKGTKGRDASPRTHQLRAWNASKAPKGIQKTGTGTPMGGKAAEAESGHAPGGVLDPAMFNVDGHAVRQFSRYMEGKRSGPDWLHKRVEDAEEKRWASYASPMLHASLPKRTRH